MKTVSYAYPSSPTARKHHLGNEGCWIVEHPMLERQVFTGKISRETIFDFADALEGDYSPMSLRRTAEETTAAIKSRSQAA